MKIMRTRSLLAIVLLAPFLAAVVRGADDPKKDRDGQDLDELKKTAPKVFIDGSRIDIDYIRTEITFVNYVWDRKEADVHVLITQQRTGSGGREYTIAFIGLNGYASLNNELKFYSNRTETDDEIRKGMVQMLKLGLAPYAARTPISKILSLSTDRKLRPTAVIDKWDFWVFSVSARGRLSGEQTRKYDSFNANLSVNRVTPESRLRLGFSGSIDESKFNYEGYVDNSSSRSKSIDGLFVKSLGEHWSAGAFVEIESSLYSNIDLGVSIAPAVEYNFFPYSQSSRRQLRALYTLSLNPVKYREETIFGKLKETLFKESLSLSLDLREKLGTVSLSVEASNYLHDFTKYRVDTFSIVNLRLYKGLSVYVIGGYSWIHDQLSLLRREPTLEEQLLRQRELPMHSNYFAAVGFQFQFGSIFTNVINPRFGSTGGAGMSIHIN